ncbi:type II toxin-antitoxin system VapC family toxin [Parapedobacter sp. DT-150]|uniref:type II toxin-antitoxin system VapC family toxin n=1 Tax=Parapedobacter sp. DT-150 TaxID=3396162 RepID=UPI003F1B553D
MTRVLIDTDVLLDFFFDRHPFSEHAANVLSLCEANVINGFITPVICSNVYYLLRRTAKHEQVIARLRQLFIIIDVLAIDKSVIIQAMDSTFKDFEDALQHYAALSNGGVDLILTRNIKDYKGSSLSVMTPESYLKIVGSQP